MSPLPGPGNQPDDGKPTTGRRLPPSRRRSVGRILRDVNENEEKPGREPTWYEVVVRSDRSLVTTFVKRAELPRLLERLRALRLELVACELVG